MPCDLQTILDQACDSGIGKLTDPIKLARVTAQLICEAAEGGGGGAAVWGGITGTLSAQTDLQMALNARLLAANNLSDLTNAATARTNLGLGTAATQAATAFLQVANNLSDLANAATARANLGAKGYVLPLFSVLAASPADSTTYYFGGYQQNAVLTSAVTYSLMSVSIPASGTITRFWIKVRVSSTLGSGETVPHTLRINDTTDVGAVNLTYAAANQEGTNAAVGTAVTAGDNIAIKIVCPAWVTNPIGVSWFAYVYIE